MLKEKSIQNECVIKRIKKTEYILGDVLTKFLYFIIKQRKLIMKEFDNKNKKINN